MKVNETNAKAMEEFAKRITKAIMHRDDGSYEFRARISDKIVHRTWVESQRQSVYRKVALLQGRRLRCVAARAGKRNNIIFQFVDPSWQWSRDDRHMVSDKYQCFEMQRKQAEMLMDNFAGFLNTILDEDFDAALKQVQKDVTKASAVSKQDHLRSRQKEFTDYGSW